MNGNVIRLAPAKWTPIEEEVTAFPPPKARRREAKLGPEEMSLVLHFQLGVENLAHGVERFQPLASHGKNPGDLRWGALAARVGKRGVLCG